MAMAAAAQSAADNGAATYTILTDKPRQTILHFGASDAWSMKYIGRWPESEQLKVADWLFSTDTLPSGKPKGIGLSLWRFNLGAGSEEQREGSKIQPGTRTECLVRPDGTFDNDKQQPERRFIRLAKERGVPFVLAFLNSPPVYLTQNGLATNTGRGGTLNLRGDCYDDFAAFIAKAIKGIESHDGVRIDYVSPLNEPDGHWNWLGPKQEGTPATNRELARVVRLLDKHIGRAGLQTKILVNESSDLRCLLGTHLTDWQRADGLAALFSKDSTDTYVGDCKSVLPVIAGHSYWTNTPTDTMRNIRTRLREAARRLGVDYWQTELCIMSNDTEIGGGGGYDFGMKTALYVARVIHHDLVYGNACSWSWWRAAGGDYRDGLIRIYGSDDMTTGWAADSKLMWVIGNFSRFVRPGAVRYDICANDSDGHSVPEGHTDVDGVMCSAYRNCDGSWVAVAINYADKARRISIGLTAGGQREWVMYRTSDASAECLLPVGTSRGEALLVPRSVTTFVSLPRNGAPAVR